MSSPQFVWQEPSVNTVERFEALAQQAAAFDGAHPFSEQTLVEARKAVREAAAPFRLLEARDGKKSLGFAALVAEGENWVLEAAVAPDARERRVGSELIKQAVAAPVEGPLFAWVHGGSDASSAAMISAQKLAKKFGFEAQRELYKMGLALSAEVRASILARAEGKPLPGGLKLASFTGADAAGWVEANAAAFADHPEQGRLTEEDLNERLQADWFRPEGFFLAKETDGAVAGFHWTKIPARQEQMLEGEVYAVGITPHWQGRGLGKALTLAGMAYLADAEYEPGRQLERIVLYVDADNTAAVSLYRSLGFSPLTIDRQYTATRR